MKRTMIALCVAAALSGGTATLAFAQGVERSEAIASSDALSRISMYSYRDGPKSDLLLRGTPLAATAEGKVQVEYQNDNARISAEVQDLPQPASLGPYTTYVLWAVTPDGRATNRGVIGGMEGGKGQLETNYGQSQFALIVTAEPHFAVTIPSTMMVLYNVGDDVKGAESKVTTLTERVDYSRLAGAQLSPPVFNDANPLEVVQARYAIAIARAAGAEQFSSDAYVTAKQKLAAAEAALAGNRSSERKTAPGLAREAVIAGEDARRAALLASTANAVAERQRAASLAATNAANATARVAATAAATKSREAATAAETKSREAATAAATGAREAAAATAATTQAREAATATAAAASSQAASQAAAGVERERAAVAARDDLRKRLNEALPTRDSSRGLVAEIGGVQFATGNAQASAAARESLAKFSGIVASYPGLRFNVEGHTDSVGSVAMNNELSLKRAMAVRDYLIEQGVPASSIDVAGLGLSTPIGDNGTTEGRARNRRVEIVVSGGPLIAAN
ncbi:MAG TPA: OmpA family protein [Gammaproteobacteria bacterium]|nr:OmpA family protein [Gammaproteobacteria bacterium]